MEAVFLARSGTWPSYFFIGKPKDVRRRIATLNATATGLAWELVAGIESDDAGSLRSELFRKYADRRKIDYFHLTPADVEEIKAMSTGELTTAETGLERVRRAKSVPCVDCGASYPYYVMDLDHLPGARKKFNLSSWGLAKRSMEAIEAEIAKCEAVCSNCHRIRTHTRRYGE